MLPSIFSKLYTRTCKVILFSSHNLRMLFKQSSKCCGKLAIVLKLCTWPKRIHTCSVSDRSLTKELVDLEQIPDEPRLWLCSYRTPGLIWWPTVSDSRTRRKTSFSNFPASRESSAFLNCRSFGTYSKALGKSKHSTLKPGKQVRLPSLKGRQRKFSVVELPISIFKNHTDMDAVFLLESHEGARCKLFQILQSWRVSWLACSFQ